MKNNTKYMLLGQSLSFLGDYCMLPALLVLSSFYESTWVITGVIIVRSLPLIIQPFIGHLIDRYNKIKIMIFTDAIRGTIFLLILFLPFGEKPIIFLSLLFFAYFSGVFFTPARLATMSLLGEDIKVVNTLFSKYTSLFIIIGGAVGGIFAVYMSVKYAIILNSITYFLSAYFISKIKLTNEKYSDLNERKNLNIFKGFSEIISNKFLFQAVFTMLVMAVLWGIIYSYFPIISMNLENKESGNFILTSCIGIGGIIGASLVKHLGFNTLKGIFMFSVFSVLSLITFIFDVSFIISVIMACIFFSSMEYGEVIAKVNVQENADIEVQGRIFAISEAIIGLSISVGSIFINFTNRLGITSIILMLIILFLINVIITYKPNVRKS